jgi:GT2 family glycosyltransferase
VESIVAGELSDFEIIVVDQSEDDLSHAAIARRFDQDPRVRYLHSAKIGLSHARNLGAEHARSDILVFIDDDAVASRRWLPAYRVAFRDLPSRAVMLGGRISPEWEIPCPRWYPASRRYILGLYDIGSAIEPFPPGACPPGANFAMRRAVFREIGGFDLELGFDESRRDSRIAGEDTDMAQRVLDAGYEIWYVPMAEVVHFVSANKLDPKHVLRRFYWEGRSFLMVRRRASLRGPVRSWRRMLLDRLKKRALRESPHAVGAVESVSSHVMRVAITGAFAVGAGTESVRGLLKRFLSRST